MKVIAWFFYALAFIDFVLGNFCEVDITGVFWSPILLGGIGAIIEKISSKKKDPEETESQE